MTIHTLPAIWDAKKFATRYSLDLNKDFYVDGGGMLVVFPTLPDDPPIFEASDPFVSVPAGVHVHHWPELVGWVGHTKITAQENGTDHHECYYVIADNEVALNNLAGMQYVHFEVGQPAYLKDKLTVVYWDGVKWAKPK